MRESVRYDHRKRVESDREFLDSPEVAEAVRYVTSRRGRPVCYGIDFINFIQDLWADASMPGLTGQTRLRIFWFKCNHLDGFQ